jgi:hypothetical protein
VASSTLRNRRSSTIQPRRTATNRTGAKRFFMKDVGYEFPRKLLIGNSVNRGKLPLLDF